MTTKLWVGDYVAEGANTFGELAKKSEGIKKIAVLRADVDNLGTSFVYGFRRGEDERYVTLSRTAALSRQLSLFSRDISTKFLRRGQKVFLQKAVQEML